MPKVLSNIWNSKEIDRWLEDVCRGRGDVPQELLISHMKTALRRALMKEPSCLMPLAGLPPDPPLWLRSKWNEGQRDFHSFTRDDSLEEKIRHVQDWIGGAIASDAAWLKDTDTQGRPKKLLKIGTLAQATAEADKAMRRLSARFNAMAEGEGALEVVKEFSDGHAIVKLLTPQALDRESGMMGHCVGDGNYDRSLEREDIEIYSLRDAKNRAHVTFEVFPAKNTLAQCKGKENKPPVQAYFPYVQEFLRDRRYKLSERPSHTGLLEQDGIYYSIFDLPENLHWRGYLDFKETTITTLPEGLQVGGWLDLCGTAVTVLPKGLKVGGALDLSESAITALPEGLQVGRNLYLNGTAITALPEGLRVGGNLALTRTAIAVLPTDIKIKGDIFLPDGKRVYDVEDARIYLASWQAEMISATTSFAPL